MDTTSQRNCQDTNSSLTRNFGMNDRMLRYRQINSILFTDTLFVTATAKNTRQFGSMHDELDRRVPSPLCVLHEDFCLLSHSFPNILTCMLTFVCIECATAIFVITAYGNGSRKNGTTTCVRACFSNSLGSSWYVRYVQFRESRDEQKL